MSPLAFVLLLVGIVTICVCGPILLCHLLSKSENNPFIYPFVKWDDNKKFDQKYLPKCSPIIKGVFLSIMNTPEKWRTSDAYTPRIKIDSKSYGNYISSNEVSLFYNKLERRDPRMVIGFGDSTLDIRVIIDGNIISLNWFEKVVILKALADFQINKIKHSKTTAIESAINVLKEELTAGEAS